ncbi:MAG: 16S rRNA (guanine(966)-N(2))-methyltransferase RsmD [Thermobacillus sp. ZCTH02-B1]|uniref:16S rRNA (guanine(966)-N(2))-methyltransferase RsmD n=1 Tax=Thermobacillus sp. ZCTH02-B1 TaxID=1858795 RepID=UPI000B577E8E|nr:16S rRNA (guanine(966)-N(2))-methyltransferase RsmD [Thermobacillus sp. ZCTH02-B1]OUM96405.1 MAG: 16S rRNA (guanine(966)-N(2))-methyltransferase RsmD [Thermobacillus sp. ZCTH02-B1]
MRVIAGAAKGTPLRAVPGLDTRPTSDRVKEAIFSMIGPYFDGGHALDLFAGTGGLGIEALSRGAERAVFIDADRRAVAVIRRNVEAARVADRSEVHCNTAERALRILAKRGAVFRYVFLDPPYRMKIADCLMAEMEERGMLENGAVIVVEHEADFRYPETFGGFRRRRMATYGGTAVSIYHYHDAADAAGEDIDEGT